MNKELRAKSNEELCSLIVRLKLQLLESRFRMASGELEKLHTLPEIRKTIARAMTVLNERAIRLTIGTHGVTMYNDKTKEVKSITNLIDKSINSLEESKKPQEKSKTKMESIKTATTAAVKAMPNSSSSSAKKKSSGPVKATKAASAKKVATKKVTKTIRKKVQAA